MANSMRGSNFGCQLLRGLCMLMQAINRERERDRKHRFLEQEIHREKSSDPQAKDTDEPCKVHKSQSLLLCPLPCHPATTNAGDGKGLGVRMSSWRNGCSGDTSDLVSSVQVASLKKLAELSLLAEASPSQALGCLRHSVHHPPA